MVAHHWLRPHPTVLCHQRQTQLAEWHNCRSVRHPRTSRRDADPCARDPSQGTRQSAHRGHCSTAPRCLLVAAYSKNTYHHLREEVPGFMTLLAILDEREIAVDRATAIEIRPTELDPQELTHSSLRKPIHYRREVVVDFHEFCEVRRFTTFACRCVSWARVLPVRLWR